MKSYAQLAFNSRCKDITDFIKVVVQKTHKICAKNALLIFLILLLQNFHSFLFEKKCFSSFFGFNNLIAIFAS